MVIEYIYKGKKVAEAKREVKDGLIVTKYLLPHTGRYVKWMTFFKRSELPEEILDIIKTNYWLDCDKRIFDAFSKITIDITHKPAVILAPWDKFHYRERINNYFFFDVVTREEHYPTVVASSVDYVSYDDFDATLAKVGYELMEKHFPLLLEKWRNTVNVACDIASEINKKTGTKVSVQFTTPTKSNPVFEKVLIGIDVKNISLNCVREDYEHITKNNKKIKFVSSDEIDVTKDTIQYSAKGENE